MAIQLEFFNLIVPIRTIEEKYPGGWHGCLRDHAKSLGRVVWFDYHLFRTGTMDPDLMDGMIEKWARLGFEATEIVDGKKIWKDLCVIDAFGFTRYGDCPWIVIDGDERTAWMRETERGEVLGRDSFR